LSLELAKRGASVDLVLGPSAISADHPDIKVHKVQTAEQMYKVCIDKFPSVDVAVMSAAVADYTPMHYADQKIKKNGTSLQVELVKTKDILKSLGEKKRKGQILVGFALETRNEKEYALGKLNNKNADLIVMNSLNDEGAGFGHNTNKITIFEKNDVEIPYERKSKQQVAKDIVDRIVNMLHD